jgi:hypothetical protein
MRVIFSSKVGRPTNQAEQLARHLIDKDENNTNLFDVDTQDVAQQAKTAVQEGNFLPNDFEVRGVDEA